MIATAEHAREWFTCAYDLFDRLPGADAREARDTVWNVSDALADDATPEECQRAHEAVTELVRTRYATPERVRSAITDVVREQSEYADEYDLATPADHVAHVRNTVNLPGVHAIGAIPVDYAGTSTDRAYVVVLVADDAMISEALGK